VHLFPFLSSFSLLFSIGYFHYKPKSLLISRRSLNSYTLLTPHLLSILQQSSFTSSTSSLHALTIGIVYGFPNFNQLHHFSATFSIAEQHPLSSPWFRPILVYIYHFKPQELCAQPYAFLHLFRSDIYHRNENYEA